MATTSGSNLDQLLDRIERREATARRRTVLLSLIPIVIAAIVLGGMTLGVRSLSERAERARADAVAQETKAREQEKKVAELQARVGTLEKQLQQTTDLARFRHDVKMTDLKMIASRNSGAAYALEVIFQLAERRVKWKTGGRSPEEGFDSPGFAMYVLRRARPDLTPQLPSDSNTVAASDALMRALPREEEPSRGDLVFYPAGYALFRFVDLNGKPFVIGMTPVGVVALEPTFAEPVGAAKIRWR